MDFEKYSECKCAYGHKLVDNVCAKQKVIDVKLTLTSPYVAELNTKTSKEFLHLAANIESVLGSYLSTKISGYTGVQVNR